MAHWSIEQASQRLVVNESIVLDFAYRNRTARGLPASCSSPSDEVGDRNRLDLRRAGGAGQGEGWVGEYHCPGDLKKKLLAQAREFGVLLVLANQGLAHIKETFSEHFVETLMITCQIGGQPQTALQKGMGKPGLGSGRRHLLSRPPGQIAYTLIKVDQY